MAFNLGDNKLADQRSKDSVFGFIKGAQRLFPVDTYHNIPALVAHVCLAYYYVKEYFVPKLVAHGIEPQKIVYFQSI